MSKREKVHLQLLPLIYWIKVVGIGRAQGADTDKFAEFKLAGARTVVDEAMQFRELSFAYIDLSDLLGVKYKGSAYHSSENQIHDPRHDQDRIQFDIRRPMPRH